MTSKQSSTATGRDITTTSRNGKPGTTLWERARHGYPAAYPIVQLPNPAILLAAAGLVIALLSSGTDRAYALSGFFLALTVWAWLELIDGVNWPHRVLGGFTLAWIAIEVGQRLVA
ncbi:hypothetical protein [Rhodococcus wratislaviensis]|uniref:hypothetical protein n=1 Tax=Rhodococcus wratislaviensis TaxID=44752 RepID=UPI0036696F74